MLVSKMFMLGLSALSLGTVGITALAQAAPSPIDILPTDANGIILIKNDPKVWEGLTKFGLFPADFSTPAPFFQTLAPELNFNLDIEPWLGETYGMGYMPDGKMVMIAPIKDDALATAFLDRLANRQNRPAQTKTYQGIEIKYWLPEQQREKPQPDPNANPESGQQAESAAGEAARAAFNASRLPGVAIAKLPSGFIVRAETPDSIQQLIDAANQPRFSSKPEVQQFQQDPRYAKALFAGFGDYGKIILAMQTAQLKRPQTSPKLPPEVEALQPTPEALAALAKIYGGVSGFIWAEPQGIRMKADMAVNLPVPITFPAIQQNPEIFKQLPGVTYGMSNSQNLGAYMQLMTLGLDSDPKLKKQFEPLRKLSQNIIGIDDRDLAWMDGEFAMFAFPSQQGFLAKNFKVNLGLGVIAQTSNRSAAEAALGKVTQQLQKNLGSAVQTQKRSIDNIPVVSLEVNPAASNPKSTQSKAPIQKLSQAQQQSFFSYSWVKPDTVVILNGIDSSIVPKPWQTLADSTSFKEAIAPLPKNNQGYFYLNGSATTSFVFNDLIPMFLGQQFATDPMTESFKTMLGSVRSIAGTSQFESNSFISEGIMHLGSAKREPLTAQGWIQAGQQRLAEVNTDWAIANYNRAIQLAPENPQAYLGRGTARREAADYEGAIADFSQTLSLNPNPEVTQNVYDQRGKAYFAIQDYPKSIGDLSQAIQQSIDLPTNYELRSNASLETENYQQAIDDASQLIQLDGPLFTGYSNRCYAKARLGDFKSAQSDCEQGAAMLPEDLDFQDWGFISRYCYVKVGLKDASGLADCEQAVTGNPDNAYIYENQGLAYALRQENSKAIQAWERAIELFRKSKNEYGVKRVEKVLSSLKK